jgi:cardiolipin synthase
MIGIRTAFWIGLGLVHLAVVLRAILLEGREPYSRAAWLLLLITLPGVGTVLYLLFGEPWISPRFRKRSRDAYEALLVDVDEGEEVAWGSPAAANAFRTCAAAARWPASTGNRATVAPEGDTAIDMVVADIDAATRSVHLSFYIWLGDNNGTKVVEAVCRAARRGVTCRIVADAIGSRGLVRSDKWRQMHDAGARLCASLSVPFGLGFLAGHRTDLRNHRKIVVVDSTTTWCGSQNCADPAFLPKRKFAPWVDILIRYEGPVARQAERIFASAWTAETGEDMRTVLAADHPSSMDDGIEAIAVGTGPLSPHATMTDIYVATLAAAQRTAFITTPYFAPDPPLLDAIVATARRGVELTIIFPQRNDSRVVGAISRAYYPLLARAGVRIFEFCGGLLHAKTMVIDGRLALIGSSNMDRRSLDLNFENNVLFESPAIAEQVGEHQRRWLADSAEIGHDGVATRSLPRRFIDNLLTMAAPLF